MAQAIAAKQIAFSLANRMGLAAEISAALADAKISITAMCGYEMGETAEFILMVDDLARAKKILKKLGAEVKEQPVIVVEMPNKVGELRNVTRRIAEAGVNINLFWGTTGRGRTSTCIFATSDNKKAIKIINN